MQRVWPLWSQFNQQWVWTQPQAGGLQLWFWHRWSLLLLVEKGRKSNGSRGIATPPFTPQINNNFLPQDNNKICILLRPLQKRSDSSLEGEDLTPRELPDCLLPQGTWTSLILLPGRGLAATPADLSEDSPAGMWALGKRCLPFVQLPSRIGLSLSRISVATSTLSWKGTIWSSRKRGALTSSRQAACREFFWASLVVCWPSGYPWAHEVLCSASGAHFTHLRPFLQACYLHGGWFPSPEHSGQPWGPV